jgi:hypothetical protein
MIAAHQTKKHLDLDVSCSIGDNFHDLEELNTYDKRNQRNPV